MTTPLAVCRLNARTNVLFRRVCHDAAPFAAGRARREVEGAGKRAEDIHSGPRHTLVLH